MARRWLHAGLAAVIVAVGLMIIHAGPAWAGPGCKDAQTVNYTSPDRGQEFGSRPVVFVHGWTGKPLASTADKLEKTLGSAVTPFLFDYGHYSSYWANNDHIAACLADYVRAVSEAWADVTGSKVERRVIVVAHSMGGIATRYAFMEQYTSTPLTSDDVGAVVTIATPSTGSPFGGSKWAEIKQAIGVIGGQKLPGLWTGDGAGCLVSHHGTQGLPRQCGASAAWLPRGVSLAQVAGNITLDRTLFGKRLYSVGLDSDGIVPRDSAVGYQQGGPTATAPSGSYPTWVDGCSVDTAQVGLGYGPNPPAAFYEALARLSISETVQPVLYGLATLVAPCSHVNITSDQSAINQTTEALRAALSSLPLPQRPVSGPVLTTTGLGPIEFGDTVEVASSYLDDTPLVNDGGSCWTTEQLPDVLFVVRDGIVVGAGTYTPDAPAEHLITDRGISLESTREEILAAYPGMTRRVSSGDAYTSQLEWEDGAGGILQVAASDIPGEGNFSLFAGLLPTMAYEELCAG